MFKDFLSDGQKQIVGIALTPGIGLEAILLDKTGTCVVNYGRKKVEYNFSSREIQDYVQFKSALAELVEDFKIPPKSPAYLILPNVYFDFFEVPQTVEGEDLKTAILSTAEDFYLFKKEEPVSGWAEVVSRNSGSMKRIAYSPIQKNAVNQIKDIFSDVSLQLVGIENNYSATLRGLYHIGALNDVIADDSSWTMMLIGTNSYSLFHLEGKNLMEYSEVPLAIKSFSMEEAYQAIVSSASQALSNYQTSKLYIISQTDDICADILRKQMQFDRDIIAIDSNNKYSKKPLLEVISSTTEDFNQVNSLTLASIGATIIKSDFGLSMNLMADDPAASMGVYTIQMGGATYNVTSTTAIKLAIVIVILMTIVFGTISGALIAFKGKLDEEINQFQQEIQNVEALIAAESKKEDKKEEIDMTTIIDEIAGMNVSSINFYDSISSDIPKNIWLTKYYNKEGDRIAVRGIAQSIIDIYEYYKNLRIVSPQSDIKLTELKVVTDNLQSEDSKYLAGLSIDRDTDRLYSFEISNTQMQVKKIDNNPNNNKKENDESVIIPKGGLIEQTSQQMRPTE